MTITQPHPALTLVMPLRKKDGMTDADFYEYWLNAHVTLPPRFPGLNSVWLHCVSFENQVWPVIDGVSARPAPDDEFQGVPEATFLALSDLEQFQAASGVQMDDGINFLSEMIAYAGIGPNSATAVETIDPAPVRPDTLLRHLVFLRRRSDVSIEDFRQFVTDNLVPALAATGQILKLRRHLFEPVEVTLDHPGVRMSRPLDRQYQAALEVVVQDEAALSELTSSPAWKQIALDLARYCSAMHAVRDRRCVTTKHDGRITLPGIRGVAVADVIDRLDAASQRQRAVSELFLPQPISQPVS